MTGQPSWKGRFYWLSRLQRRCGRVRHRRENQVSVPMPSAEPARRWRLAGTRSPQWRLHCRTASGIAAVAPTLSDRHGARIRGCIECADCNLVGPGRHGSAGGQTPKEEALNQARAQANPLDAALLGLLQKKGSPRTIERAIIVAQRSPISECRHLIENIEQSAAGAATCARWRGNVISA